MKKSIILLLVLLPIVAFSQMQHIISQGSTATTQRILGGNNTIDSSLIKIRSIDAHNLLVSMPDSLYYQTVFAHSTMGTNATTLLTFPNLKIYDFKIFAGNIYFCGQDSSGVGFISWMTLSNLFSTNPQAFTVQKITNPITLRRITDLEVYKWDDGIHVVALADNRFLIDMNTFNPSTYQIMRSVVGSFRKLSVGKDKIITLGKDSDTSLVITAFDKGNISQYMYRGFTHPILRYDKYVLENSLINEDVFTFGYTHREYTSNNYYKTDFATIEVTNGIHIINKQYLEIPDGKLEPIDLEFCIEDSTLLYLAGGNYGHDEIFPIKHFVHNDYVINTIQPNCSISNPIKQYNSIIRYENYYFAAFAKDTPSSRGLIFDCKRDVSSFLNCASSNTGNVINTFFLGYTSISANYTYMLGQQDTIVLKHSYISNSYTIQCQ